MATPDSEISGFPEATTWAAGDWFVHYDISETDPLKTTKKISGDNLMGKTSGIPVAVGQGIAVQAGYQIYSYLATSNVNWCFHQGDGATGVVQATANRARFGAISTHAAAIIADNAAKVIVEIDGNITCPATYSHDMAGETIRAMYVNDSGHYGYTSSSLRYKTNIKNIGDTSWIYQLVPREFNRISNPTHLELGLIAEEVEAIPGIPHGLLTYQTYICDGEGLRPITDDYENAKEMEAVTEKNVTAQKTARKIKGRYTQLTKEEAAAGKEIGEPKEIEEIPVQVKKVVETVEYERLIIPMLEELKKLRQEVNALRGLK